MIVDAHHHFWNPAGREYPWMAGRELDPIRRPFGPDDLQPLLEENGVERTVLVQTVSSLDETKEFLGLAAASKFVRGVVGWVDLTSQSLGKTFESLDGGDLLVGVRHQVHDEPDPDWLLRADVQRGIAAVGEHGLVYDLLVRTRELPAALVTVRRNRDMSFVIDHAAKPRIAGGSWDVEWERALAPFGDLPNVTCKLSGLVTEAEWSSWTAEQLEPYVRRCLDWFGPERCMFGTDWPVCLLAADYTRVVRVMRDIIGDDDAVFSGTATRVYGLG